MMDDTEIRILGAPCGRHGPYTFHKAFSTTTLVRTDPTTSTTNGRHSPHDVTDPNERTTTTAGHVNGSPTSSPPDSFNNERDTTRVPSDKSISNSNFNCNNNGGGGVADSSAYRKQTRVLAISDFCVVRPWSDSALLCVAELQLLWTEHRGGGGGGVGGDRTLASLRLYVEPDSAPELNTLAVHGEDEVLAISEKVVLRLEDLVTWMTAAEEVPWTRGLPAMWYRHGGPKVEDQSSIGQSFKLTFDRQLSSEKKTSVVNVPVKVEEKAEVKIGGAICCDGSAVVNVAPSGGVLDCGGSGFVPIKPEPPVETPAVEISDEEKERIRYVDRIDSICRQNEDIKAKLGEMYEVKDFKELKNKRQIMLSHSRLELADVDKEKDNLVEPSSDSSPLSSATGTTRVVVLSYSRYCRHRALAKRLEPPKKNGGKLESRIENVCTKLESVKIETKFDAVKIEKRLKEVSLVEEQQQPNTAIINDNATCQLVVKEEEEKQKRIVEDTNRSLVESLLMSPEMEEALIQALGGYVADDKNTRILFCRETFSYPDLETHEMLCNHLAPKLKGRPRGRRKKQILPIFNSAKKRQLLAVNLDKNKGRKINQDDEDDERRMLQMLAALSDSGGDGSGGEGGDGAGDSDDAGSEHMPCAATVARMTTGGGRQGLRCNSRKTSKSITSLTPLVSRKRKQSDNSYIDNPNQTDDEDSNDTELNPEMEQKAREDFEQRLRDFNRDAMMDGYNSEKNPNSGGGLQGVTNNTTGTKMAALMGDGKKLDMYMFYSSVQRLGGYDSVTASRQWRGIFEDLVAKQESKAPLEIKQQQDSDDKSSVESSSNDDKKILDDNNKSESQEPKMSPAPNAASATVTRRHYEKSLLAFERFEQANNSSRSNEACRDPLALDAAGSDENSINNLNKTARQKLPKKPQNSAKSKDFKGQTVVAKKKLKSTPSGDNKIIIELQDSNESNSNKSGDDKNTETKVETQMDVMKPINNMVVTSQITTVTLPTTPPNQNHFNSINATTTASSCSTSLIFHPIPATTITTTQSTIPMTQFSPNPTPPRTPTSSSLRSVRVKQDRVKQGQQQQNVSGMSILTSPPGRNVSPPAVVGKDKAPAAAVVAVAVAAGDVVVPNQNVIPVPPPAPVQQSGADSDDNDVIEVIYKPATPEVINLIDDDDEQPPIVAAPPPPPPPVQQQLQKNNQKCMSTTQSKFINSQPIPIAPQVFNNPSVRPPLTISPNKQGNGKPQLMDVPSAYAAKRSKLEMLQQAGLEVTPVRQQHMLLQQQQQQQQQQLTPPIPFNTQQFGFRSPAQQKTVYGNPRDILTPQQLLMSRYNSSPICLSVKNNAAVQPVQGVQDLSVTPQSALDLSVKPELQNIPLDVSKSGNLEITLVSKQGRPAQTQKRNANGKFVKTPPAKSLTSDLVIPRYQPQQQQQQQQQQVRREVALDRSNSVSISLEKPRQPIASKPVANVPPYFVEPPHNKQVLLDNVQQQQSLNFNSNEQQLSKQQQQQQQQPAPGSYLQYLDPVFLSALCAATAQQQQNNHQQNQQQGHQQQQAMLAAMLAAGLPITPATHEAMQLYGLLGLRLPSQQQHK